jgi:hypothetical protein
MHEFVDDWPPNMASQGVYLAVFRTAGLRGVMVAAEVLRAALRDELGNYE